ncbi:MAG: EpsG family protein [Prevotella sp.]|jgi:hypothetical protein
MLVYIVGLLAILLLVLNAQSLKQHRRRLLVLWVLYVGLVCGLGDMLGGYDRYIYGQVFDNTADDRADGASMFATTSFIYANKEQGYALYNYLVTFLTSNRYIFILITTLLIYLSVFRHIIKYSKFPITAFFVFFCLYYFFTFTYLRQVMALCVAWFSIPFAVQRRPIPFFAIIVIAATFHNSALLFVAVYFIANKHFTPKQIKNIIVLTLLLGLTPISQLLFDILGGMVNEEKTDLSVSQAGNTRIAYIIEAVFFLYVILKRYDRIAKDKLTQCLLNIALLFIFILCFFVRFPDGGRMSWYFLIGIICIAAEILVKEKKGSMMKIATISVMIVLYLRILFAWGIQLSPYKTFLTNGYRENDEVREKYEYDLMYDTNKLYRPVFGGLKEK